MENNAVGNEKHSSDEPFSEDWLKGQMKQAGWEEGKAFFKPTANRPETSEADTKPRTDAERKATQRQRRLEEGWRQINVMAPNEDDARALLIQVAEAIKSKPARRAIAAVLTDRDLVRIGRKVRRLRGAAGDEVRALLKL